jgi:hypothetical protein
MIHLLEIDDSTRTGKRLLRDAQQARKGVEFRSPAINGVPPEGYMTSEEFYKRGLEMVNKLCDEYGIL